MRLILLLAQTLSSLPSHQLVEVLGTIFQPPLRVMAVLVVVVQVALLLVGRLELQEQLTREVVVVGADATVATQRTSGVVTAGRGLSFFPTQKALWRTMTQDARTSRTLSPRLNRH